MILWIINISGLVLTGYFTDIKSESVIESTLCPLLFVIFLISIVCKIYGRKGPDAEDNTGWVGINAGGNDDLGGGGGD